MNRLTNEDRCRVLACLVEGNSIRATVRITGIAKRTVSRLVVELGEACERFADRTLRGLDCKSLQRNWGRDSLLSGSLHRSRKETHQR